MIDESLNWGDRVSREDNVRKWTEQGLSSGQIAQKYGVTRNAIIGVQNRMGLSRTRTKPTPEQPFKPVQMPAPKVKKTVDVGGNVPMRLPKPVPFKEVRPEVAKAPDCPPIGLMELTRHTCRWPLDGLYCGGPALDGRPYCAFHTQKAT